MESAMFTLLTNCYAKYIDTKIKSCLRTFMYGSLPLLCGYIRLGTAFYVYTCHRVTLVNRSSSISKPL